MLDANATKDERSAAVVIRDGVEIGRVEGLHRIVHIPGEGAYFEVTYVDNHLWPENWFSMWCRLPEEAIAALPEGAVAEPGRAMQASEAAILSAVAQNIATGELGVSGGGPRIISAADVRV